MGCISGLVKYLLFLFNFLVVLSGIALIAMGAIMVKNENKGLDSVTNFSVSAFAIAVGLIVFAIAFFGCWGAIRENGCMLKTYIIIIIVLLILQIALGVMAFAAIKNVNKAFDKKVREVVKNVFDDYVKDPTKEKKKVIDTIQQDFKCCGVDGHSYWTNPPDSCYKGKKEQGKLFKSGCATHFQKVITYNIKIIGYIALALVKLELACAILATVVKNRS
ncbi:leukocyte surface antigen CD53-like [Tribolium madens]|uniref:leukocyte surface antigen CD53-like n=1 Tax=Tribolium madens TaxID=41895 RepID=UPI001CF7401F|nr:leukocyte surface antigen CD53-like [Tribolium madens]